MVVVDCVQQILNLQINRFIENYPMVVFDAHGLTNEVVYSTKCMLQIGNFTGANMA